MQCLITEKIGQIMPAKYHGYDSDQFALICSGYIKNPVDGLWYLSQEVLPPPSFSAKQVSQLNIQVVLDAGWVDYPDMVRENFVSFFLNFEADGDAYKTNLEGVGEWIYLMKFIQDIEDGKDSRLGPVEFAEDTFHVWHLANGKARFVIQNGAQPYDCGWHGDGGKADDPSAIIPPWQYLLDIELERHVLLAALRAMSGEMRRIITDVFAPGVCAALDAPLPKPTATINKESGGRYDYFRPYRWVSAGAGYGYEYLIFPHMVKHKFPPPDIDFNVSIQNNGEYYISISHGKVQIGLFMPEWTHWEECLCEWLNLLVDSLGYGAVCFDAEGVDAVLCAKSDYSHFHENPEAGSGYLNLLVWAGGSWYAHPLYGRDYKHRAIHIKIERRKLVKLFYDVLQFVLSQNAGTLPKTQWSRLPYDLSKVEDFLSKIP